MTVAARVLGFVLLLVAVVAGVLYLDSFAPPCRNPGAFGLCPPPE